MAKQPQIAQKRRNDTLASTSSPAYFAEVQIPTLEIHGNFGSLLCEPKTRLAGVRFDN